MTLSKIAGTSELSMGESASMERFASLNAYLSGQIEYSEIAKPNNIELFSAINNASYQDIVVAYRPSHAQCLGVTDIFFPDTGNGVIAAQKICATCIEQKGCLTFALENHVSNGVWGGVSERGRRKLLRMINVSGMSIDKMVNDVVSLDPHISELISPEHESNDVSRVPAKNFSSVETAQQFNKSPTETSDVEHGIEETYPLAYADTLHEYFTDSAGLSTRNATVLIAYLILGSLPLERVSRENIDRIDISIVRDRIRLAESGKRRFIGLLEANRWDAVAGLNNRHEQDPANLILPWNTTIHPYLFEQSLLRANMRSDAIAKLEQLYLELKQGNS